MRKTEKSRAGLYFFTTVVAVYVLIAFFRPEATLDSLLFSLEIFKKIIPVFGLVFLIMFITNYFVTPDIIAKYLSKSSGSKKWAIAIGGGIISSGPIYMWYPMLKQLHKKGVSYGFISAFLYCKAIKIPLMPMLSFYFGLKYMIILTVVMIVVSVIQGLMLEKIFFEE